MSLIEYGLLLPSLPRPSWVIMPYFRFQSFLIVYPGRIQWGTPRVQWFIDWFIDCFSRFLHPPRCCFFTCVYLSPHINLFNKRPEEPAEAKVWSGETPSFILWMIYFCLWLAAFLHYTTHPIVARDIFYRQVFGLKPAAWTSQLLDSWVRSSVPEHLATVPALDKDTESSALPPPWVPHHLTASSHNMYYIYEKVFILTSWNMIFPICFPPVLWTSRSSSWRQTIEPFNIFQPC